MQPSLRTSEDDFFPEAHEEPFSEALAPGDGLEPANGKLRFADTIQVEKDGRTRNLHVRDIRSIRANAHYTYVSDGHQEFFCKLSISAIETSLDPQSFIRVHRSYIVSIDHVEAVKRQGDGGIVALGGTLVQCDIPVARARLPILQKRVADHVRSMEGASHAAIREQG